MKSLLCLLGIHRWELLIGKPGDHATAPWGERIVFDKLGIPAYTSCIRKIITNGLKNCFVVCDRCDKEKNNLEPDHMFRVFASEHPRDKT